MSKINHKKVYTRENCLIAIQIWEKHQCELLKEKLDENVPLSIFDAREGVVEVLYHEKVFEIWFDLISKKANADKNFVPDTMKWFGENLDKLEVIWRKGKLSSAQELIELYHLAAWSWIGLSISYCLPEMQSVSKEDQDLGMSLRERSAEFLEDTDHVIQNTLRGLYPELGDLIKYISIEEVEKNEIPAVEVLKERERHYIYFDFEIHTNINVHALVNPKGINIITEGIPADMNEISGQTAMKGKVVGKVRVLTKKSEIQNLEEGEILVTAMTTPDYLPAMNKAAAFVTDEGGITCHAAIVAREIGKPCVIGTKNATRILKTGDIVEVDADNGVVKILK